MFEICKSCVLIFLWCFFFISSSFHFHIKIKNKKVPFALYGILYFYIIKKFLISYIIRKKNSSSFILHTFFLVFCAFKISDFRQVGIKVKKEFLCYQFINYYFLVPKGNSHNHLSPSKQPKKQHLKIPFTQKQFQWTSVKSLFCHNAAPPLPPPQSPQIFLHWQHHHPLCSPPCTMTPNPPCHHALAMHLPSSSFLLAPQPPK